MSQRHQVAGPDSSGAPMWEKARGVRTDEAGIHAEIALKVGLHAPGAELVTFSGKGRAMPNTVLKRSSWQLKDAGCIGFKPLKNLFTGARLIAWELAVEVGCAEPAFVMQNESGLEAPTLGPLSVC